MKKSANPRQVSNKKFPTREAWLTELTKRINKEFFSEQKMPRHRVTCGWPSRGALASKKRTIGQCFDKSCSDDKSYEIIISMVSFDALDVSATLAHEMIHAIVGIQAGHRKPFGDLAREIGLEGKLTATYGGAEFQKRAKKLLVGMGKYPHAKLDVVGALKKQTTRLIKCTCASEGCGFNVRITRKWIDEVGTPICPAHPEEEMAEA